MEVSLLFIQTFDPFILLFLAHLPSTFRGAWWLLFQRLPGSCCVNLLASWLLPGKVPRLLFYLFSRFRDFVTVIPSPVLFIQYRFYPLTLILEVLRGVVINDTFNLRSPCFTWQNIFHLSRLLSLIHHSVMHDYFWLLSKHVSLFMVNDPVFWAISEVMIQIEPQIPIPKGNH